MQGGSTEEIPNHLWIRDLIMPKKDHTARTKDQLFHSFRTH